MGPSTGAGVASLGASSLEKTNSFSLQPITNSSSARVELRVYLHTLHAVMFVSLKGCARLLYVCSHKVHEFMCATVLAGSRKVTLLFLTVTTSGSYTLPTAS